MPCPPPLIFATASLPGAFTRCSAAHARSKERLRTFKNPFFSSTLLYSISVMPCLPMKGSSLRIADGQHSWRQGKSECLPDRSTRALVPGSSRCTSTVACSACESVVVSCRCAVRDAFVGNGFVQRNRLAQQQLLITLSAEGEGKEWGLGFRVLGFRAHVVSGRACLRQCCRSRPRHSTSTGGIIQAHGRFCQLRVVSTYREGEVETEPFVLLRRDRPHHAVTPPQLFERRFGLRFR
jgi:hypothetical protein